MNEDKNKTIVTAYVDNQLKSPEELRLFEKSLKEDPSLKFDLEAESLVKNTLHKRFNNTKIDDNLRRKILHSINDETEKSSRKFSSAFRQSIYSRRFIAYSTAAVILIAFVLLLFNRPSGVNTSEISEQTGENNMVVLAINNFENLVYGDKSVEFISNSPQEIKKFFRESGVKYDIYIPKFENYSLVGAYVSDHKGVKLAHHIYSAKNGKYIYVFQVHENYFKGDSIIRLTNDLMNYLKLGNRYQKTHSNYTTILKHRNNNVIAMVSNVPVSEMPESIVYK